MKSLFLFSGRAVSLISIVLVSALLSGCGSGMELISSNPKGEIKIDGQITEWQNNLTTITKENYSIGFKNDDNFLYICFTTADRQKIVSIMQRGLNFEFESNKDKNKNFRILFPILDPAFFFETRSTFGQDAFQTQRVDFLYQEELAKQIKFFIIQKDYLNEVLLKNGEGFEISAAVTADHFNYELKVPLESFKSSFPIGALPGEDIKVLVYSESGPQALRQGSALGNQSPRSGGTQGGGGRRGGGGRNAQPAPNDQESGPQMVKERFETDFVVKLSKNE